MLYRISLLALVLGWMVCSSVTAATLEVGPGKPFAKPSQAIKSAHDNDVVQIEATGKYDGDVATIIAKNLTLRGVGSGRVKIDAQGQNAAGKGIWVQSGENLTVENIEFVGARCPDKNGAGIRGQAAGLTVRNCSFFDCENGILGGMGEVLVENCSFDHCGPVAEPATHSCYCSEAVSKLTFRGNYSTFVKEGHLLKSRAQENWILYNRLTDEDGTGSAVADFPNGGVVVMLGNILHKGSKGQNDRVIAYGMEGIKHQKNGLFVASNTLLYEHRHSNSWFVRVEHPPSNLQVVIANNVCVGSIPLTNFAKPEVVGNLFFKQVSEAGFVDPVRYDFHLTQSSPCVGKGVLIDKREEILLDPVSQYSHPASLEKRSELPGVVAVGAYGFQPPKTR